MAYRTTTRARGGFVYTPLGDVFYPKWKILITDDSSAVHTISDFTTGTPTNNFLISGSYTRPVTTSLASANITFDNSDGQFTNTFNGGEVVEIYADYGSATTLQFRGKIDNVTYSIDSSGGFVVEASARDYPELVDWGTTGRAVSSYASIILLDLFYENFSDIKLDFWNGTAWSRATYDYDTRTLTWDPAAPTFPTTSITTSWQNKKGWQVIQDICERAGLSCYMDYDTTNSTWVLKTFITDAIKNNAEAVTYGGNLISCNDFGLDNTGIYNSITVFGKQESDNIILLATEESNTSIASLWKRQKVINDSALTTNTEVREKAQSELAKGIQSLYTGKLRVVGMNTLKPGEQVMVFIPFIQISGYYTVSRYTTEISLNGGFVTSLDIKRESYKVANLFKEKINVEEESKAYLNLNNMTDSFNIYFDESPSLIEHSDTEEVDGKLQLQTGEVSGIATSVGHSTEFVITSCEFRRYSNFPVDANDIYEVSNDNGITWETYDVSSGEIHNFSSSGSVLKIRITLNRTLSTDTSPTYESVVLLYK
jgi:hypothetical protein